jgi:hypothetical protein
MLKKVPVYEYYQEKMIEQSDLNQKEITNEKAKRILGSRFLLPSWLQIVTINDMIRHGLLKRESQEILQIKSCSSE